MRRGRSQGGVSLGGALGRRSRGGVMRMAGMGRRRRRERRSRVEEELKELVRRQEEVRALERIWSSRRPKMKEAPQTKARQALWREPKIVTLSSEEEEWSSPGGGECGGGGAVVRREGWVLDTRYSLST